MCSDEVGDTKSSGEANADEEVHSYDLIILVNLYYFILVQTHPFACGCQP